MNEVFGRAVLPLVKQRCEVFRNDLAGKEIKIIRFAPDQEVNKFELAKYEAARFSTESKIKTFQYLGCNVESPLLTARTTKADFKKLISNFDLDPNIIGIIVQNPIPVRLEGCLSQISYLKDLDGMRPENPYFRTSATSETIYRLVKSFAQPGDTVAVVGAKGFVGAGVVKLLKETGINTIELDAGDNLLHTCEANIVVSATGVPELLDERHIISEHRLVVDAGFVPEEGQPILGDVNRSAYDIPQYLTPVPGGVGPFQMATLLERLVSQVSEKEIEPWVYPGPAIERFQTIDIEPATAQAIQRVAGYYLREESEELDGVEVFENERFVIEQKGNKLTISALDGRGVIYEEEDNEYSSNMLQTDIDWFEAASNYLFPSRERELEDDGFEMD